MDTRPVTRFAPAVLVLAGLAGAAACTLNFPAVKGLGTKVRLPVFHGAMTWVNLAGFSVMAVLAVAFLVTRRQGLWRWEGALRAVSIPLWLTGSVLGLLAALNTWDFTGSKASPLSVAAADPRLMAQFWVALAALALVALAFIVEEPRFRAVADIAFVALLWTVIMRAVLGPGRALHPDSPVLNSDEIGIKLLFFGIVVSVGAVVVGVSAMLARRQVLPQE